jgi:hypothetical protein
MALIGPTALAAVIAIFINWRIKMKMMFNKTTYEGHWFEDNNKIDENYTEKAPPDTGYIFDENINDWILKPIDIID